VCKGQPVKVDKFSGGAQLKADRSLAAFAPGAPWNWGYGVLTREGKVELILKSAMHGTVGTKLMPGWGMLLLLADGTKVAVTTSTEYVPQMNASENGITTTFLQPMSADAEALAALAKSEIVAYRADFGNGALDFNLPKPLQKPLRKSLACAAALTK